MPIQSLLGNITEAISQISISGVKVKDKDEISASWVSENNVLYPRPDEPGFLTNLQLTYLSIPRGEEAKVDFSYTLNYRFLSTQIGDMAGFTQAYSLLIDKTLLILAAMVKTHAPYDGRVDMEVGDLNFGAKVDPAGNSFHGVDIALNITEMQNV
jgi:hypothetical protein